MLKTSFPSHMSLPLRSVVTTRAYDSVMGPSLCHDDPGGAGWYRVIERALFRWDRHPAEVEEDGIEAPSRATLAVVVQVAKTLGQAPVSGPDRTVADANGGIVFEREDRDRFETLRVSADGSVEHYLFEGCRLVMRESLPRALFGAE
jgi:hypothetical protein